MDPVQEEYASLIRSAAAGDTEALDRLLLHAQEGAGRFSNSVRGYASDAEDAMQEALIKTYRMIKGIERVAPMLTFSFRGVEVRVHGVRQDAPPRMERIEYEILHELHVWGMASSQTALTAHLVLEAEHGSQDTLLLAATHPLQERFKIRHVTLQLEFADCPSDGRC